MTLCRTTSSKGTQSTSLKLSGFGDLQTRWNIYLWTGDDEVLPSLSGVRRDVDLPSERKREIPRKTLFLQGPFALPQWTYPPWDGTTKKVLPRLPPLTLLILPRPVECLSVTEEDFFRPRTDRDPRYVGPQPPFTESLPPGPSYPNSHRPYEYTSEGPSVRKPVKFQSSLSLTGFWSGSRDGTTVRGPTVVPDLGLTVTLSCEVGVKVGGR